MPIPQWMARVNRKVTNRVTRRFADRLPGFGIVIHRGRRSGKVYHTPVNVFRDDGDFLIALTYGADADWVHNIEAADGCVLVTQQREYPVARPRIFTDTARQWAPPPVRLILTLVDASQYMRLTPVSAE
jgi:deazaflavin-dependent oxidoreductase (nitroreductase family)